MTRGSLRRYAVTILAVGLIPIIKVPIESWVGTGTPFILFVPAVTFSAWFGGLGPGVLATVLSVLICNYFYVPPIGSFLVESANDLLQLAVFLVNCGLTSVLMQQLLDARRLSEASATEAKAYREAVRRERDFAESLIAAAQAIVLVLDHQGRVVRFNPFFEHLSGRRSDSAQGADWFTTFVPQDDQLRARQAFERSLSEVDGGQVIHGILTDAHEVREIEWSHRLLPGDASVLSIGHDITALKEAQRRALQVERLAAIGQMVTGLAHESRNALQRSQACLEMLVLRVGKRPEAFDLLVGIQQAQDDLHRLYEEVRNYAAPIILDRRPCSLGDVLREAWEQMDAPRKGRSVRLREHGARETTCAVDRFRFKQVFRNVLDNALAACHDPAEIDVFWSEADSGAGPSLCVVVADNGPGLTPDQERNLFEPFFTTKTQGTGLGMAIAKRIVEAHGGAIFAENGGGPGARIVITVPKGNV